MMHTFADLVARINYEQNRKVRSLLENFPSPTEFIGIVMPDRSIINIEGHHRATALAIAAKQKIKINFRELPTIVLTFFKADEVRLLDTMLARGSIKEDPK